MPADPLREFERLVRKLVVEGMAAKKNLAEIQKEIVAVGRRLHIDQQLLQIFLAEAAERYNWISDRTMNDTDRRAVSEILSRQAAGFAQIEGVVQTGIVRALERGIRLGKSVRDLENVVAYEINKAKYIVRTITNTGIAGFDRANGVRSAIEAGVEQMRYMGPSADRPKCREWLGKTFRLNEISTMSNGQNLPVLYYCGGWNCRHWWEPVID